MTGGRVLTGLVAWGFVLAAVSPVAAQTPEGTTPRFRSSVDLVSVAAVVKDRKGRFVKDLAPADFEIVEAGRRRPIIDFRAELNGPVKLAVLLDISGSMRVGRRTDDAQAAANHIFSGLSGGDQAAVFTFDTTLLEAQPFTTDHAALSSAIASAEPPYGQTSLYDAIAATAREVAQVSSSGTHGLPLRSAVVVITDGVDTRSNMDPAAVAKAASEIDVPVYIVAVVAAVDDPRETNHERSEAMASDLRQLARGTGGELFIVSAPAHASVAARQMIGELRHQYVLAFEASSGPGWRPLSVRTRDSDLTVRARTGYSGGETASSEEAAGAAVRRTSRRTALAAR